MRADVRRVSDGRRAGSSSHSVLTQCGQQIVSPDLKPTEPSHRALQRASAPHEGGSVARGVAEDEVSAVAAYNMGVAGLNGWLDGTSRAKRLDGQTETMLMHMFRGDPQAFNNKR